MSTETLAPAEAPVWEGWSYGSFEAWFHHNGARLQFSEDVPAGTLGTWKWEQECSCKPERLILTMNSGASGLWGLPSPKHHGDWSREAAIAHMVLHVEDGTQCAGYDPQQWGAYERELDTRAMARMGWESWRSQTIWDEQSCRMVPWELEAQRVTSHVAKSELRRRSTVPASVGASKGRR